MCVIQRFIAVAVLCGVVPFAAFAQPAVKAPSASVKPTAETAKMPEKGLDEILPRLTAVYTIQHTKKIKPESLYKILTTLEESSGFKEGQCAKIKKGDGAISYQCDRPNGGSSQAFLDSVTSGTKVMASFTLSCPSKCGAKGCGGAGYDRCIKAGTPCSLC